MGQLWSVSSLGGYLYSDNLSDYLRTHMQPASKFRDLCDMKDAGGLHKGQTFNWNVYSDISDDGTLGKVGLSETETMPEDEFTITVGSLTITERGRAVPFTNKLELLSEHSCQDVIRKVLGDHAVKSHDRAAHAQFALCPLRVVPTGGTATSSVTLTTNGTATLTNNVALGKEHVKSIVDTMKERNIPAYRSGDYYAIGWPSTYRNFKNNLEGIHQYVESGMTKIMNGEMGRYEGTRFLEQTNVPKGTGSTANSAWGNSKSDWVFFMGVDTVIEGLSLPEEIRAKTPGDYGRSYGIAWYGLTGYGLSHTTSNPSQGRIVMWDSAA